MKFQKRINAQREESDVEREVDQIFGDVGEHIERGKDVIHVIDEIGLMSAVSSILGISVRC